MLYIIVIFAISFSIYLFMGFYVLSLDSNKRINQLFFLAALSFALGTIPGAFLQASPNEAFAVFWYKIGTIFSSLGANTIFIFCFYISNLIKKKFIISIISLIPSSILNIILLFISKPILLKNINNFWILIGINPETKNFFYFYMTFFLTYSIGCLIIIILWIKKINSQRIKKMGMIFIYTYIISYISITGHIVFFVRLFKIIRYDIPGINVLYFLIWMFGLWYAIIKYRFLSINPAAVSNDIIANISESIILLDNECRIITANDKTKKLTNNNKLEGQYLSKVILEHQEINNEITEMFEGKTKNFSCRLHYKNNNNQKILMDTKFSLVKDKFKDNIGIMIIGYEVKEIKQLMTIYKITDREAEIIQNIIAGCPNNEITKNLDITENTLKKHIFNIYNKLGVDNKIQLMNLLKDFNFIPEQKADKTVFLLRKPDDRKYS